jgi:predicted PurR-regulated permease PerM
MSRARIPSSQPAILALLSGMAIIAILYFGRDVLLPFALSLLLTFLLVPLVNRLQRWHIARVPAVLIAVAGSFAGIFLLGFVLFQQVYDLAYRLPEYESNITDKIQSLRGDGQGVFDKVSKAFEDVRHKIAEQPAPRPHASLPKDERPDPAHDTTFLRSLSDGETARPIPVQIVNPLSAVSFFEQIMFVGPRLAPFGTAAMVIVFGIFMLIEREDLRNRLIYLIGSHHLNNTTLALDSAAHRLSRYLRMQLIVNAVFGLWVALGLFWIGVPNPLLWGVAAILLRFVPYVGPIVASLVPVAISLAVFDGWVRPVSVIALYGVGEMLVGNVLEPRLISSSTGISALGILVSTVFWMWLWGPIGLILATPLTVCLAVLSSYVPRFAFLNALLSDEHVLPAASRFYQRLLASDLEEALEVAEDYLKGNTIESLYDVVLVPALGLAEQDRHNGDLEEQKQRFICDTVRELIEDLGTRATLEVGGVREPGPTASVGNSDTELPVSALCLPASDEADEIVGLMLAQLLAASGVRLRVLSTANLASEMIGAVNEHAADVVCISALPPFAATHARYLCKRLCAANHNLKIIAGLWQSDGAKKAQDRLVETGIDGCVTTLSQACEQIVKLASSARLLQSARQ